MNPQQLYQVVMDHRKTLLPTIFERTQNKVISGPFKDMTILPVFCWGDGDIAGKLLGLYEDELYPIIEDEITKGHDLIINYGCAEGYYGIGLAMRVPTAKVVLFDIAQNALDAAKKNAEVNGATNVEYTLECNHPKVESLLAAAENPLIIMDCEGAEILMLDPTKIPSLKKATVLVETHDCISYGITDELVRRFDETHELALITQGTKNLYIDPIHDLGDIDKMILNCENRPSTMGWLHMVPWKE